VRDQRNKYTGNGGADMTVFRPKLFGRSTGVVGVVERQRTLTGSDGSTNGYEDA